MAEAQSRSRQIPDIKKSSDQQTLEARSPLLDKSDASRYRSTTMGAAYLAQDRLAVRNLACGMVTPTEAKLADLKRLIRNLKRYPDVAQVFSSQQTPTKLRIQADADVERWPSLAPVSSSTAQTSSQRSPSQLARVSTMLS